MSIDLGNNPVGTPPTDEQKTQLRSSIGLGSADTVQFGAIVPPAGTTAEIDLITNATVGQVMIDTDRNRYIRFTAPSTYETIGYTSANTYYVDPQHGDDTSGSVGGAPFATINSAMAQAVSDNANPILINCMSGAYSEEDAFNGISVSVSTVVNIKFDIGCTYNNPSMSTALFNLTSSSDIPSLKYIGGNLSWLSGSYGFFNGHASSNGTYLSLESVPASPDNAPLFTCLGGDCIIDIAGIISNINSAPVIKAEGSAIVNAAGLRCDSVGGFFSPSPMVTTLSDTATLKLTEVSSDKAGLCEITSDTGCKLVIVNSVCTVSTMANPKLSIKAPSGSTQPEVYAQGNNAAQTAASNITVDTTFGQFTVDANADKLLHHSI
jgi:hypothetical protein